MRDAMHSEQILKILIILSKRKILIFFFISSKSAELIPDVYIIEISFAKSFGTVYTTNRNK